MKVLRYITTLLFVASTMLAVEAGTTTNYTKVGGVYYSFSGSNATVTGKSFYAPSAADIETFQNSTYIPEPYYSQNLEAAMNHYTNEYSDTVVIPANVTYSGKTYTVNKIANYAFCNIKIMGELGEATSIAKLGSSSTLTSVNIPYTVTSIGKGAFAYCKKLTKITCHVGTPISIKANVFQDVNQSSCTLAVPTKSVAKYKAAAVWKNFKITSFVEKVVSVSLNKSATSLYVGENETLKATALPSHADNTNVTWQSNNKAVATVDANGKVTAVAPGTATIRATAADGSGKSAACTVTVLPQSASSVTMSTDMLLLEVGSNKTLVATVMPANASNTNVTWQSNNKAVATVDANGKVTAVAPGMATIRATAADGSGLSSTCIIAVTAVDKVKDVFDMVAKSGNLVAGIVNEVTDVPVILNNTDEIAEFSFTMVLPERIEPVDDIDSFIEPTERGQDVTISVIRNQDGTVTVTGTTAGEPLAAGGGPVLNLRVKTAWQNTYTIPVTNMTITTSKGDVEQFPDNETKLVMQGVRGDMNGDGRVDASDALYIYHLASGLAE